MITMPLRATDLLSICALVAMSGCPFTIHAQTPSPLQEWQYSRGLILERMFESEAPDIHAVLGAGLELQPAYDGSRAYRVRGGPAIDVRYHDVVFISTGEGIGYNFVRRRGLEVPSNGSATRRSLIICTHPSGLNPDGRN